MRPATIKSILGMAVVAVITAPIHAEVVEITARVETSVIELKDGVELQSDTSVLSFPDLATVLPLAALAKVDRLDSESGATLAAARGLTLFSDDLVNGQLIPNDFGIELAGLTNSGGSSWILRSNATQTRRINFKSAEVALPDGQLVMAESTVYVAGALIIVSDSASRDLTGTTAKMQFTVTKSGGTEAGGVVLDGGTVLSGKADSVVTTQAIGAVSPIFHGVLPLDGIIPEVPVVRVLVFNAALPFDQFGYSYEAKVGEEFTLQLDFAVEVIVPGDGIGAAAVFGLPQVALEEVFAKVRENDSGAQIQDLISQRVDTTGSDRPAGSGSIRPIRFRFPNLCGSVGLESAGLAGAGLVSFLIPRRRRRSR